MGRLKTNKINKQKMGKAIDVFIYRGKSYSKSSYSKVKDRPMQLENSGTYASLVKFIEVKLPKDLSIQIITNVDTNTISIGVPVNVSKK